MADAANNLVFLSPLTLNEMTARYGRWGVFSVVAKKGPNAGKTFHIMKTINNDNSAGVGLGFVAKNYDRSKPSQVAQAIRTNQETGEREMIKILCNTTSVGELEFECSND